MQSHPFILLTFILFVIVAVGYDYHSYIKASYIDIVTSTVAFKQGQAVGLNSKS